MLWAAPASSAHKVCIGNVEQEPEENQVRHQQRDPESMSLEGVSSEAKLKGDVEEFAGVLHQGSVGW